MAGFKADLSGDKELVAKFNDLGGQLTRWGYGQAFRPAAYSFLPVISNAAPKGQSGRLSSKVKVRSIKKSRQFAGVQAMSMFGTQQVDNDPYYGAFVNWGHEIVVHGVRTGKRTKQYRFEEAAFQSNISRAVGLASYGLRYVVESIWNGQQAPSSSDT